jgi:hypothetical protein
VRAQLWRTLGRLGLDHRPGVGLRAGLPDLGWVEVPAGPFLFGEEKRKKTLLAFRIARYPLTNAQYQTFIDDGGYETDAWWEGMAERVEPARGSWTDPNQPRETVSWYEAMAYSRWLEPSPPGRVWSSQPERLSSSWARFQWPDDVRQYGKVAPGQASGAGVGSIPTSRERFGAARSRPTMPARRPWITGGRSACIARGEEDLAKHI